MGTKGENIELRMPYGTYVLISAKGGGVDWSEEGGEGGE